MGISRLRVLDGEGEGGGVTFPLLLSIPTSQQSQNNMCLDKMIAQRGARTHDPEIKSLMLYRLS